MRREIAAVAVFLKKITKSRGKVEDGKFDLFVERLTIALQEKFKGHWYPETPNKGQAYRCIRVNMVQRRDPELLRACRESGVKYSDLALPHELTLWVDPGEVCCRYREHNPCFSVATFTIDEDDKDVAKRPASALGRAKTDYDSGSVSDERSTCKSSLPISTSCQKLQNLNPEAPSWHPRRKPQKRARNRQ